jgi:hypothetical protein
MKATLALLVEASWLHAVRKILAGREVGERKGKGKGE